MHSDAWTVVRLTMDAGSAELVADALHGWGVAAIEEITEPDGQVTLRTSLGDDVRACLDVIATRFPEVVRKIEHVPRSVADTWRAHAVATRVDDELWLVPAWLEVPTDQIAVLVEPFDTFGLGNHPTTVGALRLARSLVPHGSRLHDHGTGSGVIAIAMAKTHDCIVSVDDIHPGSRAAVEHNARLNGVSMPEWLETIPVLADVIVSNILAPVLRDHAAATTESVRRGGLIVLAGIRSDQVGAVVGCHVDCDVVASIDIDGWIAVALRRQ